MTCKLVTAPLSIKDMDSDLESQSVYIFDYNNSKIQGTKFLDYICSSGIIADVYIKDVSLQEKILLLKHYIKSSMFYHLLSFNATLLNLLYKYRNIDTFVKYGFLSDDELIIALKDSELVKLISLIQKHYNSLFGLMLNMLKVDKNNLTNINKIKSLYKDNISSENIYPNIYAILLDPFFYDYFKYGVDSKSFTYYNCYYDDNLYDHKPLIQLIINDYNYPFKILYDSLYNEQFKDFIKIN